MLLPMSKPLPALPARAVLSVALALLLNACGGGDNAGTKSTATATGAAASSSAATPTKTIQAATTRLAVPVTTPADPLLQGLAIPADAATRGMWGPVQTWPMNAIHMALLPDGRVLGWGAPANQDVQDGRTFALWTPSLGFGTNAHVTSFEAGRVNSFCGTATWLGDNRLLITGGNTPRGSQFFSGGTPLAGNDSAQLADDRWYATMLTLPDGRAVMLGGIDPYTEGMYQNPDQAIAAGQVSMTPEIYTPGTGWRSLTGASSRLAFGPDNLRASYPRAWVAPNGEVFGISADQMWWLDVAGNNGAGALRSAGVFKGGPSNTTPRNVGATNSAVMFAPGRILQLGGNGGFNGDGFVASDAATVIDINSGAPVLTETARMSAPRRFPSATVLADGRVLVTGGTRAGNNGGADAVYAAELWNPATGTWTVGPNAARIRVYHSGALLLPNGAVLTAGGGTPGPVFNLNAEVYYPPYLFRAQAGAAVLATRPVVTGVNALTHAPGANLVVEMRDAATISRLVLVKAGTVTHSFNNGQRFIPLTFLQNGDLLQATLPASNNTLPPGHYLLTAIDAAGVPSHAVTLRITAGASTATPLPRNSTVLLQAGSTADGVVAVDAANLGVLQTLGTAPDAATLARSQWTVRDGLADSACVSLELAAQPGRYLRHAGFRLQLAANDGTDLFRNDATFCPEAALAAPGLSLRSKNYPGHLLRARGTELWIDPQAADVAFASSASFRLRTVQAPATPLPTFTPLPAAPAPAAATGGTTLSYTPGLDAAGLSFSWSFGDGTPDSPASASSAVTHSFAQPGVYTVTLTARNQAGQTSSTSFLQAVVAAPVAGSARSSSALLHEARSGASARVWVANPDGNSVAVVDAATNTRVAEVAVGASPRSLARAGNGQVWVVNRGAASISVVDAGTLAVVRSMALPAGSQPHGIVFSPDGANAYVSLEASGRVLKLDAAGATVASLATGGTPRGLAISADGSRLYVSRFITAPLPGEGTATVTTTGNVGGELWLVNTGTMAAAGTVWLRHSDRADSAIQGAGVPNGLGAPVLSPDGRSAWVPSKQDNIKRGVLRNGLGLDFQNTVRAVSSRIDLAAAAPTELTAQRVDHDNASVASAAAFHPSGAYLFVALETSRQVAVVDAARGLELFRIEAGLAPQALAVSPDGLTLYVQNFMGRTLNVVDLAPLLRNGRTALATPLAVATQGNELLQAQVLQGKRLFYDARDPRLARDSYMSCAACHADAGHDGRTWDFTGFGEGLRNTPALKGRAGMGQGFVHWSANFDELQDFEGQIRSFAGGTGLMTDAQFNTGTRNAPLGDKKAGASADLDALAAYLGSLTAADASPNRNADGTLTAAALAGKTVFANANCASCHGGAGFTTSSDGAGLKNIGTLKAASGKRLGGSLSGIDVPTLRDVWATAPYLHDGSAPTLAAAVQAHAGNTVAGIDLANLVAYLQQIGSQEPAPAGSTPTTPTAPPATAVACAAENGSCTLPAGATATVWYGANASWAVKTGVTGSIACNNATFGDPLPGTVKACRYSVTSTTVPVNLAPLATLATSYVSPWESLAAVNNNITPANSADKTGGAYGNWQGTALYGRTDWVSFSWPAARRLSALEVYWWNDGQGIATPTAARVEAWNGTAWVLVGTPGLVLNRFNRLDFSPVTTTSMRVTMRSTRATGILEARVWGN